MASVSHRPQLIPPLPRPHVRPKRLAALNQDATANANSPVTLAAMPPDVGETTLVSDRIEEGAAATFLSHASKSSRTRGQPVSDC